MNPKFKNKRKFVLSIPGRDPWKFYAEDWLDAEEIIIDMIEEDMEDRVFDAQEKQWIKEDKAYDDYTEAV